MRMEADKTYAWAPTTGLVNIAASGDQSVWTASMAKVGQKAREHM